MDAVPSVRELQRRLEEGVSCKIEIAYSERMRQAVHQANAESKLDVGVQLVPKDSMRVLLAAVCDVGPMVAKAALEGYTIGLRRKGHQLYLYFSKHDSESHVPTAPAQQGRRFQE